MQNGFWEGEPTAKFVGVTYEVSEPEKPTWWTKSHVGKRRQGIQITYEGSTWIIDNEHGDGYFKVTEGMGSPWCSHKIVTNPLNVIQIPDEEINTKKDLNALVEESMEHDAYLAKHFPEEFKQLVALKEIISKSRQEINSKLK